MKRLLRHRVGVLVFALTLLALLGALLAVNQARLGAERDRLLTVALTMQIAQMRTALFDYLLDPQPQSYRQAQDELAGFAGLLEREAGGIAAAIRHDAKTGYAWENVRRLAGEMQALVTTLEVDAVPADPRLAERHRRTLDLILVDSHALILFVSQLNQRAEARVVQATGRQNLALGVLVAGAGGLVFAFFRVVEQRARLQIEITERRRLESKLLVLADTDPLTGAANRRSLTKALEGAIGCAQRYRQPVALVMFDLDWFKAINDTHGHDCGDAVLVAVVERLRPRLRGCDTLARWGGEEFMILLPETALPSATAVAQALRAALHTLDFPGLGRVTASFGVADYRPAETLDAWLKRVDDLVYQAKRAGRDQVVCAAQDQDGETAAA